MYRICIILVLLWSVSSANAIDCLVYTQLGVNGYPVVDSNNTVGAYFPEYSGAFVNCPSGAVAVWRASELTAFINQVNTASTQAASASSSAASNAGALVSLAARVSALESASSPVSGGSGNAFELDPQQAGIVFFLFLGIPLTLFVSARGFGTMMNLIRGKRSG